MNSIIAQWRTTDSGMNSCDNNLRSLIKERMLPFLFFWGGNFKI